MEFFLPHPIKSSSLVNTRLWRTASSIEPVPPSNAPTGSCALLSHHFILCNFFVRLQDLFPVGAEIKRPVTPLIDEHYNKECNEGEHSGKTKPPQFIEGDSPGENKNGLHV